MRVAAFAGRAAFGFLSQHAQRLFDAGARVAQRVAVVAQQDVARPLVAHQLIVRQGRQIVIDGPMRAFCQRFPCGDIAQDLCHPVHGGGILLEVIGSLGESLPDLQLALISGAGVDQFGRCIGGQRPGGGFLHGGIVQFVRAPGESEIPGHAARAVERSGQRLGRGPQLEFVHELPAGRVQSFGGGGRQIPALFDGVVALQRLQNVRLAGEIQIGAQIGGGGFGVGNGGLALAAGLNRRSSHVNRLGDAAHHQYGGDGGRSYVLRGLP